MINSIRVENFRCFQHLEVEGLRRFNIVVGSNASGKTAFLESIFLPGGGPQQFFGLSTWRGLPPPQLTGNRQMYEQIWRDLFYQFDRKNNISILLNGTSENTRKLDIFYENVEQLGLFSEELPNPTPSPPTGIPQSPQHIIPAFVPIVFRNTDANSKVSDIRPNINDNGQFVIVGSRLLAWTALLPSCSNPNHNETAQLFSKLSQRNKEKTLIDRLNGIFPYIQDLSVQVSANGMASLYCSLDGMDEKIPIGLVSTGINRLIHILLLIANIEGGVVLIDEIENGFHYKIFPKVWESIISFCNEYKVQIFASTHSRECLEQITPFLREHEADFRLLRVEQDKKNAHYVRVFSGNDFEAALETGTEFR